MPILECIELSKSFRTGPAVNAVSFRLDEGEFFSLLGPSGCGKTTTLRLIAGLEAPDRGDIRLGSRSVLDQPAYARGLGMVFQQYALFPHLSVERNISYGLERRGVPRSERTSRVRRILELVKLAPAEFAARRPAELSGGERQRVALARALVTEPRILLLDEPLGALDLALRKAMQLELKALNRALGISFLHVTHDQEEALALSDRVAVMDRGRIVQIGTPRDVYERPRTGFVARFIGESNVMPGPDGRPVSVRPERITLRAGGGNEPPGRARAATVIELLYQGERVTVLVALERGERLFVSVPNDGRRLPPEPGSAVLVDWQPEDGWPLEES